MRVMSCFITVLIVISSAAVSAADESGWQGSGGWGMQGAYGRLYNPATVETVSGQVVSVDRITPMQGMGTGIHLKLRTKQETLDVHLGPAWYIERQDARIERGDTLEVKGSRVTVSGKPAIIAAEVKKGDQLLKLRDDSGIPYWSGWRRGR